MLKTSIWTHLYTQDAAQSFCSVIFAQFESMQKMCMIHDVTKKCKRVEIASPTTSSQVGMVAIIEKTDETKEVSTSNRLCCLPCTWYWKFINSSCFSSFECDDFFYVNLSAMRKCNFYVSELRRVVHHEDGSWWNKNKCWQIWDCFYHNSINPNFDPLTLDELQRSMTNCTVSKMQYDTEWSCKVVN